MLKKHPEIVQKNLEMKQKIVSSNTQTLLDADAAMTILPQNNHLEHVSDILTDIVSSRETEPVKSAEPSIMSPKSTEPSILSPPSHHPEEKSIATTTGTMWEEEVPRVPVDVPLIQTKRVHNISEEVAEKMEMSQTKGKVCCSTS